MKKSLILIFWLLIGVFIFVLLQFFVPTIRNIFKGPVLFLAPLIIFSFLGLLLCLAVKEKDKGLLRNFLILTGISAGGFFVFVLLHNMFYALAIIVEDIVLLKYLAEGLHIASFFIAIIACPLGFLIGAIGSIVLFIKK